MDFARRLACCDDCGERLGTVYLLVRSLPIMPPIALYFVFISELLFLVFDDLSHALRLFYHAS